MDRKKLIREYKDRAQPRGIFRVLNRVEDKSYVAATVDVPAALNRERFQLGAGLHTNAALQADWKRLGADAFVFETLDLLTAADKPETDPAEELQVLEQLWLERLSPWGERGYNTRPRVR